MTEQEQEQISIDPENLTLREVDELETLLGVGIDAAFTTGSPKAKAIAALVWITRRREEPELTFDEVFDMNLSAVNLAGTSGGDSSGEG